MQGMQGMGRKISEMLCPIALLEGYANITDAGQFCWGNPTHAVGIRPGRLKMLLRSTRALGCICQSLSDNYRPPGAPTPTPLPNPSQSERSPLAVALLEDNSVTWRRQRLLEGGPGEFSYPSIIRAEDGLLHIVYTHRRRTIQHVVLDEAWIEEKL
jgi:hypothetical protein